MLSECRSRIKGAVDFSCVPVNQFPFQDTDEIQVSYPSMYELMLDLKGEDCDYTVL